MSRPLDPRLLRAAPATRRLLVAVGGLQFATALLVVAQAGVLADLIARIFTRATHGILGTVLLLGALGLARAALSGIQEWATARASLRIRRQLRDRTLAAAIALGPDWARRQRPGLLVTAAGPGLDALDGYVTRALPATLAALIVPPVVLLRIGLADWQSAVVLLVLLPLVPLFMVLVGVATRRHVERQHATLRQLAGRFTDLLRGLTTLRAYGRAEDQEQRLRAVTDRYRRQTLATLRVAFLSGLVLDLLATLSVAVVAVDIGLRLDGGHVAFGTALLVLLLAPELFAPLRAMGTHHHATEEGGVAAGAALDIVATAPDAPAARSLEALRGDVTFERVSVRYPDRDQAALRDVTLRLEAGRCHALTGPSGAGKSTMIAVLLGFVPLSAGRVVLEGAGGPRALQDVAPDRYRRSVAWLPQRPSASRPTVGEEVRLGDPTASEAAVAEACRRCRAPEPAVGLGEDGRTVSAGQLRRVALARVLLRARAVRAAGGVPLVLLDEPSEDLDTETEGVVADVVAGLHGWATVVIATHSEVLAALADTRVRFAGGRLAGCAPQDPQQPRSVQDDVVPDDVAGPPRVGPRRPDDTPPPVAELRLRDLARAAGLRRRIALAAGLAGLGALSALGLTGSSMWLISRAAQHPNVQALAVAVVGVRTFAIGRALLRYGERLTTHDAALRMLTDLRVRVFAALRSADPAVLGDHRRGDLLRRFVGDVDGVQEGVARALVPAFGAVAGAAGAVVVAALLDPVAGALLGAGLLLAALAVPWLAGHRVETVRTAAELAGQRDRSVVALVDGIDILVAYGAAESARADIERTERRLARAASSADRAGALATAGAAGLGAVSLAAVVLAATHAVGSGRLGVVGVAVLAACVLCGFEAVAALAPARLAWARCRAGLARVAEILAEVEPPSTTSAAVPAGHIGIEVDGVTLAPTPRGAPVLTEASLVVRPGERVALAGPSGCGKSTLLAATLGLRRPRAGRLAVTADRDRVDLATVAPSERPAAVAGSLQGDHVFDTSLRDNLRVVRPEADDARLDQVAGQAGLGGFVRTLPDGWDTPAGPDGAALSGGQRQRLLLARALLADPAVLVLDEPAAHLDRDTEEQILAQLLDATAGRTVLLSSHRRLPADRIDRTVRISGGTTVLAEEPSCS